MSRRKDDRGRVLKAGESLRKDGRYQYRYTDAYGNRQCVYDEDLNRLRQKEDIINRQNLNGLDYAAGLVTVVQLVERYTSLKRGVRYSTKVGYQTVINRLYRDPFGQRQIKDIKVSDVKLWFMDLQDNGCGYSTITTIRGVLRPAFQMAYNEDAIRRNPFDFTVTEVVINDTKKRVALTDEQQDAWMTFIKNDSTYSKYYDEFVVLLNTGMRVSEFCGLTLDDLDFKNRRINVDHQLVRERGGTYYIEKTKTECGRRYIPMSETVRAALENMIASRPRVRKEMVVDGYKKFLMLDKDDKPKVALHIENEFRYARKKYAKYHPEYPLPHITPHVFRHTFCTNMAFAGMDLKNLQYLMGHSDASVTMNVYTHVNYDKAAEQMSKITDFTLPDIRLKAAQKQMDQMQEVQTESVKVVEIPSEKVLKLG